MYRIIAYESPTDKAGHVVYDPRIGKHIVDGKLRLVENEVDNLTLTVNPDNWLYGNGKPFITHIDVYQDGEIENHIFRGRCLDVTREMKDTGEFLQTFVFEDILNYLQDSIQRHLKVQNTTPAQFFQKLIDVHNSQVPEYKRFNVRTVNVTNSTDNVYRYVDYVNTWETIKDKLVSRLGGVIRTDYVDGKNYIDYMTADQGALHSNDMEIQIGKNMQSLSVQEDPTEIITRLVPLGATIEADEGSDTETDASQPRVDISSVNNGKDYIDMPELQAEYGIINGTNTWDDVHEPDILLTKAKDWIAQQAASKETYTISALELPQFDHYVVSDRYEVINPNVVVPVYLRVIQKDIDFNDPYKSALTIGDRASTLSKYQLENVNAQKQANNLKSQIAAGTTNIGKLTSSNIEMQNKIADLQKQIDEINANNNWQAGSLFVDISSNQGNPALSWYQNLANNDVQGAIVKLTENTNYTNEYFDDQKANVIKAGMKFIGTYHYLKADTVDGAKSEAQYYLKQLQAKNINKSTIVACDLEDASLSNDKTTLTNELEAFHKVLSDAGYTNTTDYSTSSWMSSRFTPQGKYKWIASWGVSEVPTGADAWQYNNKFNEQDLDINKSYNKAFV